MRIIGYRKADFTTKDGIEIKGWNAYIATEIDPRYGAGLMTERVFLSDAKLEREGIELEKILNRDIRVYYNRYRKVDSITVLSD